MRTTLCLLALLALSLDLRAQQTLKVTPQTLAGWTLLGTDAQTLAKQTDLSLPAGSQLAQAFKSGDVALKFSTQPVIGPDPADYPVLELGSSALIFSRGESGGKLVLLVGDGPSIDLPFLFALDADGRSTGPLTVGFSRQGAVISVTMDGQTLQYPSGPGPADSVDVVASAGASQAWSFSDLEVTLGDPAANAGDTGHGPAASGSKKTHSDNKTGTGTALLAAGGFGTEDAAAAASTSDPTKPAAAPAHIFEIFTPPGHRLGRVDAIRAAASAQPKGK